MSRHKDKVVPVDVGSVEGSRWLGKLLGSHSDARSLPVHVAQ
jgi:hypothetical protein